MTGSEQIERKNVRIADKTAMSKIDMIALSRLFDECYHALDKGIEKTRRNNLCFVMTLSYRSAEIKSTMTYINLFIIITVERGQSFKRDEIIFFSS